ncbi:GNAT family N-acetyltransferase [Streptomyces sp. M92]|uniref:GNAT family N-acetyltransferase n=1 Tax=Streptomyces sp. M92 TaxID=2944250 RepID=UPI00234B52CD|nr:GNAT family N-acetyltransferase [Streptomyces sp. M92]WCN05108.1 GNAT family N-acetyltransferase [Streptomyces sp. M92]
MTDPAPTANGCLPAAVSITGLGLQLREWDDTDAPVMVELFDEPQVDRWTPLHHPFDLAAARAYLDQARTRRAEGRSIQLAITSDGHTALGEILLFVVGPDSPSQGGPYAELAYAVGIRYRRQHLATRAVRLMTDYAYQALALQQVILRINPDNAASTAVARATGFHITNAAPITRGRSGPLLTWRHQAPEFFPRPSYRDPQV